MCGIIGIFNNENASGLVAKGISVIRERGKEAYGIATEYEVQIRKKPEELIPVKDEFAIGHCLHSVVGFLPQPIIGKGKLAANCEIYNWKELCMKHGINAKNDAELLLKMLDKLGVEKSLDEIDGVYAFAYWLDDIVYLCRDILGIKPMWYHLADSFSFASEKKVLEALGFGPVFELNPRKVLAYDIRRKKISLIEREFFSLLPVNRKSQEQIEKETAGLLINAIAKRIPDKKFGLLLSGGVDSTTIAIILKQLGLDFTCYLSVMDEPDLKKAEDLAWAIKASRILGLKLKIAKVSVKEIEKYLKKIVSLIEDTNVTKVGVALTFFTACELARKDGIKVIFSGLGSEEIFAGYDRHKRSLDAKQDINKECYSGLLKLYERDTYRDDVITMANNLELRLPFLDKSLVDYALKIPGGMKINSQNNKIVLRNIASKLGLPRDFSNRKKVAAQYGSRFNFALDKLARQYRFKTKAAYLRQFYPQKNLKLGILFSGGKDSTFAMHIMEKQNYEISCLISLRSANPDSYMFHTPNIDMTRMQAEAIGLPLIEQETKGEKENELADLKAALILAKKEHRIDGVVTGALYSNYQRERIESIADSLGLKIFSPLWHMDQEMEMRNIIDAGFKIILSSVAAEGLNKTWLGRELGHKDVDKLVALNKKIGLNIAGEGGEFESLVVDGPMFKKKIQIVDAKIISDSQINAKYNIKKAKMMDKN